MAMIPSNYSINIAIQGERDQPPYIHWARVELGSCTEAHARFKFEMLVERFPAPMWCLDLEYAECSGRRLATSVERPS